MTEVVDAQDGRSVLIIVDTQKMIESGGDRFGRYRHESIHYVCSR